MSQQAPDPRLDVRGAVDLSSFGRPVAPPPGEPGGAPAAGGFVVDTTEATFQQVIEQSMQVPVVVLLWVATDEANARLATTLGRLVDSYEGAMLLARVDVQAYPQIAQAFQVQGVPTAVAVLAGQPVPLFQGAADEDQVRDVLDQVLAAAEANGITGRLTAAPGAAPAEDASQPAPEPELPPLHQKAYDAIAANDLETAIAAYEQALRENPKDTDAAAGLANVQLLERTSFMTLEDVRRAAADAPDDVQAQLDVADLDLAGGKVEDALGRLIELVARVTGDDRERLRVRLVDYFTILGNEDPRVGPARRALANALY
ncbi:tetratricopeptide repeat protein [Sanguibacter hominis ATCC BAA-789]|uniref:Tetratricopeptide repeat protein n=1 Tax=Sanguibacter hominis ATCC BAA-789 TaxID=1312740 RepID=A0A9X5IRM1_9MICO|nr:tetratricopeptide repeat protein [Sanguibacter hominis]NKX93845.1 tetratricopeptide repeat protein [Sanguibacter hominis ATCC BAA-789]